MGTDQQVVRKATCSPWSTLPACPRYFLFLHHMNIQHLHRLRITTLILGRPTLGDTVSTRTPTVTWLRRWCSRTSASQTQRELATPRTRSRVQPRPSETALALLKPTLSEFVLT